MKILKGNLFFLFVSILFTTGVNAAESEELLKVDKTLIVDMIIFIAAIFILNSLLFKPLLGVVKRREQLTTGAVEEANDLRAKVEQIKREYDEKLNEVRNQAIEERNEIRREAQSAAEELIRKARGEAQVLLEEARGKIESDAREIKAKLKPEIEVLAQDMASKILGKNVS
ncbi:MAG TPA: ATP synthase F0 subunit B [Thermodesulfobacteriota bacterium]|nr:ATP synthase F0 subunit B [Thermodesulfobacteriota bacterium]